jgi:hypothetical protein
VVQDANDSSGSFGTAATAVTTGTLTGGTGDQYAVVWVRVQAGRPWLRLRATRDRHHGHARGAVHGARRSAGALTSWP